MYNERDKEKMRGYTLNVLQDVVKKFNVGTTEELLANYLLFCYDNAMGALEFDDRDDTGVSTTVEDVVVTDVKYIESSNEYMLHIVDLSPQMPGERRGPTELTIRMFVEDDAIQIEEVMDDDTEDEYDVPDILQ